MNAVVDGLTVLHLADVVRVTQHAVHLADGKWGPDIFGGLAAAQSPLFQFVTKHRDAEVTGCVRSKCPSDEFSLFNVDSHTLDLTSFDAGVCVDVADRRNAVRAAVLGLLGDALLGFVGEVARVELRHRGHDAVH